MLRFHNYDIVCQEIPDEVTLAINITGCPIHCPGCHSQWLWENTGKPLTEESLLELLADYGDAVTCVCFMGGDAEPEEVKHLANVAKEHYPQLKRGWYSGHQDIPDTSMLSALDYVKVGPYIEELGGLTSPKTNQILYAIDGNNNLRQVHFPNMKNDVL